MSQRRRRTAFPFTDEVDERGHLIPKEPADFRQPARVDVGTHPAPAARPKPRATNVPRSPHWRREYRTPTGYPLAEGANLRGDLAELARTLSEEIAQEMAYAPAHDPYPSLGETLRLLAIHHGHLPAGTDELERRRLAALRRTLARQRGARHA